ncbi:hypothetical protein AAG906_018857 [Vitis piasezkii]
MDVSLESKSLPSVGYSRKSYLKVTSQRLAKGKLVHLHGWKSLALPSVGLGDSKDFTSSSLLAKTTKLCILALGTFPGNLSSKELEDLLSENRLPRANIGMLQGSFRKRKWCLRFRRHPRRAAKSLRNKKLFSQGCEVGFQLEVPNFHLDAYIGQLQEEIHHTVQKGCEITSQQKGDFATLCKMLPSAWSDWLAMAATSSFQLRIVHHLKHWIVDFLSFEMSTGFKDFHHIPLKPCSGFKASKQLSLFQRLIGLLQGVSTLSNEVKYTKSQNYPKSRGK